MRKNLTSNSRSFGKNPDNFTVVLELTTVVVETKDAEGGSVPVFVNPLTHKAVDESGTTYPTLTEHQFRSGQPFPEN